MFDFYCIIFGHRWKYNFGWMPNRRKCKRCGEKQIGKFNNDFKHPIKDDLIIWEKEN